MPSGHFKLARWWKRFPVAVVVAKALFTAGCGVLLWYLICSPHSIFGVHSGPPAVAERAPAPSDPVVPDPVELPPLPPLPQQPTPSGSPPGPKSPAFGPRTPNSLQVFPTPPSGVERLGVHGPDATAPQLVVVGAVEPPTISVPTIPEPPPAVPAINPNPPAIPAPTVTVPPPVSTAPGGSPAPSPAPGVPGAAGDIGPAPYVPATTAAKPAPGLLLTVPGVTVPTAPPVLMPLPRAERGPVPGAGSSPDMGRPLGAPPVPVTAVQEKLPEPRKLEVPADANLRLARARNAVKLGDFALAIGEFEKYLLQVPGDIAVREELAGVYTQAEKFAAAAAAYQELIRVAPANASRYLIALSDLLVRMRDYRGAIGALRRALELIDPTAAGAAAVRADAAARLARVHLYDEDLPSAFDVVGKYLAALKPGDPAVPIRFVSLLLDLERAKDAMPFLDPFLKALGDNPDSEVLVNNVRLYALLNDKRRALEAIDLLASKLPRNVTARLQVAENLVALENFDLAAQLFSQIEQLQPNYVPGQLAQVRMLVRQLRLTQAKALFEVIRPTNPEQILEASLARGQYHLAAGQFTEAKYMYLDILRQDPLDPDARVGLGATYEAARDLEKAKAEYSKVPAQTRGWRRARRGVATVLAAQRRFPQAYEVLTALQREAPWDPQTVLAYSQIATRNGSAAQAAEVAGAYLAGGSPTASAAAAVEGALGLSLLGLNKAAEAEAAFRSALALSFNKSLVGQYGLIRVSQRLGGGPADLGCPPEFVGDETRFRLGMSDLFALDYDDHRASDYAVAALRADPQNLAALVRVADIQQRLARESGVIDDAVATAKAILIVSPTNVRGHLTLARSYAIGRKYKESAEVYQKLIGMDGTYTLPKREVARIYYADHRYELSHDTYVSIGTGDPEAGLQAALQSIAERAPGSAPAVRLLAGAHGRMAGLGPDLARLATAQSDPLVGESILSALADYEAQAEESKGARLEDSAKGVRDLRNRTAIGAYRALVQQEPANTDALFDLGQVYGSLLMTHDADRTYSELLDADPLAREAQIALARGQAEISPSLRSSVLYESENGRNGLTQIHRTRLSELITLPLGDANEFVGFGYTRAFYTPANDTTLDGNIASLVVQKKMPGFDEILFRSLINYEQYQDRLKDRPTGDVGFVYTGNGLVAGAAGYLENVVENSESLRQDIYRYGARVTAEYEVNRRIDVGGLYRFARYSDSDDMNEFDVHAAYRFTYLPYQLRLVLTADGLFYNAASTFGPGAPNNLAGTVHPYFAPTNYTYYEAKLEYTQVIGRDLFGGANNLAYIAQYGLGVDNSFNSYNRFRLDVNWDVKSWLSVGVAGQYVYSEVYKFGSVFAYITLRLPHLYHL